MCGIIAVRRHDDKKTFKLLNKRYQQQKTRGQEGFGFLAIEKGRLVDYKRSETEKDIMQAAKNSKSHELIFHHRYPTSTENFEEAAHPIKVSNEKLKYDYYVVHNGVIWGDDELRDKHIANGFKYTTEIVYESKANSRLVESFVKWNDSEALAIELALSLENEGSVGIDVRGSIAFIALKVDKASKKTIAMYWGRNISSPLKYQHVPHQFTCIASEGAGEDVKVHNLYEYDYELKTTSQRPYRVGEVYQQKFDYGHSSGRHIGYDLSDDDLPTRGHRSYETMADEEKPSKLYEDMTYEELWKIRSGLEAKIDSFENLDLPTDDIEMELSAVDEELLRHEYENSGQTDVPQTDEVKAIIHG